MAALKLASSPQVIGHFVGTTPEYLISAHDLVSSLSLPPLCFLCCMHVSHSQCTLLP